MNLNFSSLLASRVAPKLFTLCLGVLHVEWNAWSMDYPWLQYVYTHWGWISTLVDVDIFPRQIVAITTLLSHYNNENEARILWKNYHRSSHTLNISSLWRQ